MKRSFAISLAVLLLTGAWLTAQEGATEAPPPGAPPAVGPAVPPVPPRGGGAPPMVLPGQPPMGGPGIPGGPPGVGMTDHKELVAALIDLLDDGDADVRQSVATALSKIGRQAVTPLIALLKDKDRSAALRANAAYVLGQMGPQANEAMPE